MSPILVRPVREQLEHDRIIRLLPGRYRRRFEVGINPGGEQNAPVGTGIKAIYPDAVLYSTERSHKLQGVVEVETSESINHLEVMAQWAHFGRLKVPFHLYVPVGAIDVARRLSTDHQVAVTEIWSYDNIGDQVRFTLVHKAPEPAASVRPSPSRPAAPAKPSERKSVARPAPPSRKRLPPPSRSAKSAAKRPKAAAARKTVRKATTQKRK